MVILIFFYRAHFPGVITPDWCKTHVLHQRGVKLTFYNSLVYFKPVWCILHKPGVIHNFSKTQVPITKNDCQKIAKKKEAI